MNQYDPKNVTIIIGGEGGSVISGFADGAMVTVARDEDEWTLAIGTDGEGTRSKTNNKSGTIMISLMQSSPSNETLESYALADDVQGGGKPFDIQIKDVNGNKLHHAEQAWIQKRPDAEYGREATAREWTIRTDILTHGAQAAPTV